jgi:8-oxo-dGTP pyrophosphatase MutT (NUDIX family)
MSVSTAPDASLPLRPGELWLSSDLMTGHERFDDQLRDTVRSRLAAFARLEPDGAAELRHAAVAIAVVGDAGARPCFVLTRRAAGMRRHAGQWALPGGRVDAGEDATAAALRELEEEIGLRLAVTDVLGVLDDYPTRSGYRITPVVVWGPSEPAFTLNEAEVVSVHVVPVAVLASPEFPRVLPGSDPDRPIIQLPLEESFMHAPTAAVLYQFREIALHGRTTRVAHFDQPPFAWR